MRLPVVLALAAAAVVLAPITAYAAQTETAPSEVIFIFQLLLLILVGRLLGEFFVRIGQPAVTGQLIAGILLGPSLLGALWPEVQHYLFPAAKEQKAMLDAVSQVGILLLLLLTGMDTDLQLVRKVGFTAASVSITGIVVPFGCGFALGEMLPDSMLPHPDMRTVTSLFLGTALAIASIKIVAMVVREMNYMRRNLGQLIVSSAIIDDTMGWIIVSIIFGIAEHGAVEPLSLARSVIGTALFLLFSLTIGRRIVFFVIRWTNDNFVSELPVLTAILVIMGGMALMTHYIGVHTVLGAFVAGILVGESPILTRQIDEQLRGLITAFFAPVFFGVAGLGTDLTILLEPMLLAVTVAFIVIASVGKFAGAFLGGKLGGLNARESLALALGMNARGSTEVIIATVGLSIGVLSHDLFSMIVAMAVVTTMAMPPTLRWALKRVPIRPDEEARLQREAFAERSFVANFERLLLTVDDSPNGEFASRIGGLLAGSLGAPVTLLPIDKLSPPKPSKPDRDVSDRGTEPAAKSGKEDDSDAHAVNEEDAKDEKQSRKRKERLEGVSETAEAAIARGAKQSKPLDPDDDPSKTRPKVDVTIKTEGAPTQEAVATEERKGYDMLLVGLEKTTAAPGIFSDQISTLAAAFRGPLAIVRARGQHLARPVQSRLRILVPITGSAISRRAAEIALTLARASNTRCTALLVGAGPKPNRSQAGLRVWVRRGEAAMLKDVIELADNLNARLKTVARTDEPPEEAVFREAKRGDHNLIVMGVSRRPGEELFFGEAAMILLQNDELSVLFVANESYGHDRAGTAAGARE
ncbi:MAG TPA: cation:proton antiporter [Xanthobacteraceae bacterium]|nr:cation:proton antiporter [Xanthobacteraceae bacterium]